jgi:GMP synthase (glutamine-hydrolysing)
MKIVVLDNGGQWTHREWRVIRDLGVESEILPNTVEYDAMHADGVVLSGGRLSMEGSDTPLGTIGAWIDRAQIPVLGICLGHQFLARHFHGRVAGGNAPEFGRVELTVERPEHALFQGLPPKLSVWSNHNDSVVDVPPGWERLAHSPSCPVQAMAHPTRPIYGIQFHPEVEHTEGGRAILQHFVDLCHK